MGSVAGGGNWGPFGTGPHNFHEFNGRRQRRRNGRGGSKPGNSGDSFAGNGFRFPLKQAVTSAALALTGDTIAQFRQRWAQTKHAVSGDHNPMVSLSPALFYIENPVVVAITDDVYRRRSLLAFDVLEVLLSEHDWIRSLRMTTYAFLLYGPGSYAWYKFLDCRMPEQTVGNVLAKVTLNQIVLGPAVIAVIFAWNNLWLGKLSELPNKYQRDALPTLLFGFRFWIPVSVLNFWLVPLPARVAFMSTGAIFWNFYLSSTMNK